MPEVNETTINTPRWEVTAFDLPEIHYADGVSVTDGGALILWKQGGGDVRQMVAVWAPSGWESCFLTWGDGEVVSRVPPPRV